MNVILNLIGIALVIYSIALILNESKEDSFDSQSFLQEVNDFSQLLDGEKEKLVEEDEIDPPKYIDERRIESLDSEEDDEGRDRKINSYRPESLVRDISEGKRKKDLSPENKKVLVLNDLGLNIEDIAKETNRSVREVEVILKLNNKL